MRNFCYPTMDSIKLPKYWNSIVQLLDNDTCYTLSNTGWFGTPLESLKLYCAQRPEFIKTLKTEFDIDFHNL